jgi:hypothetical protein
MINGEGTGNFIREYKLLKKEMEKTSYQDMLKSLQLIARSNEVNSSN